MTIKQFKQLLDTFGSDLTRWPSERRKDAEIILEISPAARDYWAQARSLDHLLKLDRSTSLSTARSLSITIGALREIRRRREAMPQRRWLLSRPIGAAFASAVFAGLLAGLIARPVFDPPRPEGVSVVAFLLNGVSLGSGDLF